MTAARTARWGLTLPLPGRGLPEHREIVEGLESLGYTDVWSAETNGVDAFTPLALAAGWADWLRLGTAIAGLYTRGPALLAMTGATLANLAPGLALAALRPGMLRLAAAEADAAITNWVAPSDVPTIRAVAGDECELVARIFVCPTTDAETARGIGRRMIAAYLTVPVYAAFQDWLGRGEALKPVQDAWAAGDRRGALAAIPDDLVDQLIVHGDPQACRERVAEYQAQGLDTPVIAIVPAPGIDPAAAVPLLAPRLGHAETALTCAHPPGPGAGPGGGRAPVY